jgi:spore coat polysaccharide biosynthesis protein SpsF (cytidylyltransferase family)
VTVYYLNNLEKFRAVNLSSIEIFDEKRYVERTDLELVLDEAADYFYINRILDGLPPNEQDVRSVIDFIDEKNLGDELAEVSRKTNSTTEEDGFT